MKTVKELIAKVTGKPTKVPDEPFRITLNGVIPLDPSKPMTREDRQALQTSLEDKYFRDHPDSLLVRTVIDA